MARPRVFFDVTADGAPIGRVVMEVKWSGWSGGRYRGRPVTVVRVHVDRLISLLRVLDAGPVRAPVPPGSGSGCWRLHPGFYLRGLTRVFYSSQRRKAELS